MITQKRVVRSNVSNFFISFFLILVSISKCSVSVLKRRPLLSPANIWFHACIFAIDCARIDRNPVVQQNSVVPQRKIVTMNFSHYSWELFLLNPLSRKTQNQTGRMRSRKGTGEERKQRLSTLYSSSVR